MTIEEMMATADEKNTQIRNARINSVRIFWGRGIPTFSVALKGEGWGQSFGMYDLRWWGIYPLFRIMEVVGVSEWSDLEGEAVRIETSPSKVHGIGHITDDRWFYPEREKDQAPGTHPTQEDADG